MQRVGADSQHTEAFSTEEQILWGSGVLDIDSPTKLLRTVFFLNGKKNFCHHGGDEQHLLKISQVQRYTNPDQYIIQKARPRIAVEV